MDVSALTAKNNLSSVDHVVNSFKKQLLEGKLRPGDRLPNELELARRLTVSRSSVREAMKILTALGIVEVRRGDGTYVSRGGSEAAFDPLLFSLILSQPGFREVKELRLLLEKDVISLVIRNASDSDISLLRGCYDKMRHLQQRPGKGVDELLRLDLEFHDILGRISHNRLVEKLYRFVMQFFQPYIAQSVRKNTNFRSESTDMHRIILEAVEARDTTSAVKAVETSLEVWENLIFKEDDGCAEPDAGQ